VRGLRAVRGPREPAIRFWTSGPTWSPREFPARVRSIAATIAAR